MNIFGMWNKRNRVQSNVSEDNRLVKLVPDGYNSWRIVYAD